MLRSFGYDVVSIGNADLNTYEKTLIIYRSGDENMVKAFADVIRCKNIRQEIMTLEELEEDYSEQENKANLTLLIGRDFDGRYVGEE